jgi:hypothetical protein
MISPFQISEMSERTLSGKENKERTRDLPLWILEIARYETAIPNLIMKGKPGV